jgi:hypothetical protein
MWFAVSKCRVAGYAAVGCLCGRGRGAGFQGGAEWGGMCVCVNRERGGDLDVAEEVGEVLGRALEPAALDDDRKRLQHLHAGGWDAGTVLGEWRGGSAAKAGAQSAWAGGGAGKMRFCGTDLSADKRLEPLCSCAAVSLHHVLDQVVLKLQSGLRGELVPVSKQCILHVQNARRVNLFKFHVCSNSR